MKPQIVLFNEPTKGKYIIETQNNDESEHNLQKQQYTLP